MPTSVKVVAVNMHRSTALGNTRHNASGRDETASAV